MHIFERSPQTGPGLMLALVLSVFTVSACDNGPSAVATRERPAGTEAAGQTPSLMEASLVGGEAATAATSAQQAITTGRRETADAKVQRLFERNGAAFGAGSVEAYMQKVRAFTTRPPADAETVSRPNGDTLIYQASTNTFAVVARDGTPRTMFKPDDGARYWMEQKSRAPTFGQRRTTSTE